MATADHGNEGSGLVDRRIWWVLCAGVVIAGVCAWRISDNPVQDYSQQMRAAQVNRPAPDFEALDSHNHMFRLRRYLGRHRVLVIFFDAKLTALGDPGLVAARENYPQLQAHDVQVVGVSTALPQQNRAALEESGESPFPLVTDLDLQIHDRWGRLDPTTGQPLTGVFLVDRKGEVSSFGPTPQPLVDFPAFLAGLNTP